MCLLHPFKSGALTALLFFFTVCLFGQSSVLQQRVDALHQAGTVFTPFEHVFSVKNPFKDPQTNLERFAQRLRLDKKTLEKINQTRPEAIRLELPYQGHILQVELFQANVLSDNFSVMSGEWQQQPYSAGVYYRGVIGNLYNSLVAISFFDNEIIGVLSHPTLGNLNLGRVEGQIDETDYVLYSDSFLPPMPFADCVARETGEPTKPVEMNAPEVAGCVRIFFEADYALFQNKGSINATVNYVTGFFNVVSTLYSNEQVSIAISQVYVWTVQDDYSTSSSGDALDQFANFRTFFDGDLAHLAALGGNGLGGVAYIDVLCSNSFNYGYSNINSSFQFFPTYSWTVEVVTHELGHNFSSRHTHWCGWPGGAIDNCGPTAGFPNESGPCANGPTPTNGGTIMSYCHLVAGVGINFSNGFGVNPGNAIRTGTTNALNGTCILASCPSSTCNPPTSITITAITTTSATINWTAVGGALSYTLQYRLSGSASWTTVAGATSPHVINGLTPSALYEVQIRSNCSGSNSPYFAGALFSTLTSPCAEPSNLGAVAVSGTSVNLSWTENGSASSWDVQYGATGFALGTGITVNTSSNPYTLTGLVQGTVYDFYVRAACGGGLGNSGWVGPVTFSTPFANDLSTSAVELIVNQLCNGNIYSNEGATTTASEFSPSTGNGGYWNTGISNTVWFKFLAPSSGTVHITTDISPLGTLEDTQLALYSIESPTNINHHLVSNEDGGLFSPGYATYGYYSGLTPGTYYYIQVDGWSTDVGTFCIEVHEDFALPEPSTCTSWTQTSVNGNNAPNKWFNIYTKPNSADIGLPIAAVKSTVNLGTVTVQEIKNATIQSSAGGIKYMQRYYNFSSTQNAAASKQVRLFYTDTELEALKTATGLPGNTAEDLNISHYDGTNENCTPLDNNNTGFTLLTAVTAQSIGSSGYFYLNFTSPSFSEMGAVFGTAALPLDLIAFTADAEADFNVVSWQVKNVRDVAGYTLERSADGISGWKPLQWYAADRLTYQFQDINPLPKSYYRLKIEETDGSVNNSGIRLVERAISNGILDISPNPAGKSVQVTFHSDYEQTLHFTIFGVDGRSCLSEKTEIMRGTALLVFDVSTLPSGIYFVSDGLGNVKRLVVGQ